MRREWDSCSLLLERAGYQWEDLLTSWVCINNPSNALGTFLKWPSCMFMNILNQFDIECYFVSPAYAWVMMGRWREYFTCHVEFQNPFKFMPFTTCMLWSRQSVCCVSNGDLLLCWSLPYIRCNVSPAEERQLPLCLLYLLLLQGAMDPKNSALRKLERKTGYLEVTPGE